MFKLHMLIFLIKKCFYIYIVELPMYCIWNTNKYLGELVELCNFLIVLAF